MRHGRTDWNDLYKLQGQTDTELNEDGRKSASAAREKYGAVRFDICYCSPLKRAKETAAIFLEGRNVPIVYDERLKEMSFGEFEGVERCIEKSELPISLLFSDPLNYMAGKGGETFEELYQRTGSFLKEVVYPLLSENKNVLIVGHGAMNLSIINQVKGIDLADFWSKHMHNCELLELIGDNKDEMKVEEQVCAN